MKSENRMKSVMPSSCLALLFQTSAVSRVTLDKLRTPSNQRQDVNLGLPVDASCAQQSNARLEFRCAFGRLLCPAMKGKIGI